MGAPGGGGGTGVCGQGATCGCPVCTRLPSPVPSSDPGLCSGISAIRL